MTATTLIAFDPKPQHLGLVRTFKATAAILRGSVVAFDATGEDDYVSPAGSGLGMVAGVALKSQATVGGPVPVAMIGSVLTVMMAADDSAVDAGHWVMVGAVAGTVIEFDPAIGAHAATIGAGTWPIGYALRDSVTGSATVGSKVMILIAPCPLFTASA
jgi:hypothetical protein